MRRRSTVSWSPEPKRVIISQPTLSFCCHTGSFWSRSFSLSFSEQIHPCMERGKRSTNASIFLTLFFLNANNPGFQEAHGSIQEGTSSFTSPVTSRANARNGQHTIRAQTHTRTETRDLNPSPRNNPVPRPSKSVGAKVCAHALVNQPVASIWSLIYLPLSTIPAIPLWQLTHRAWEGRDRVAACSLTQAFSLFFFCRAQWFCFLVTRQCRKVKQGSKEESFISLVASRQGWDWGKG